MTTFAFVVFVGTTMTIVASALYSLYDLRRSARRTAEALETLVRVELGSDDAVDAERLDF
jgi:CHASE3 domain sensor protein